MTFRKKRYCGGIVLAVILVFATLLSSCGILRLLSGENALERNKPLKSGDDASSYAVEEDGFTDFGFGKYKEPSAWRLEPKYTEMEGLTLGEKRYYVMDGVTPAQRWDSNISVEVGSNRYTPEEHMQFRDGILSSLGAQLQGAQATVGGGGSFSENGYVLYEFTIDMEDEGASDTTQSYIVGDKKYFLIIGTDFHDPNVPADAIAEAIDEIANSFVWYDIAPSPSAVPEDSNAAAEEGAADDGASTADESDLAQPSQYEADVPGLGALSLELPEGWVSFEDHLAGERAFVEFANYQGEPGEYFVFSIYDAEGLYADPPAFFDRYGLKWTVVKVGGTEYYTNVEDSYSVREDDYLIAKGDYLVGFKVPKDAPDKDAIFDIMATLKIT
jgi:hypothetical protein